MAASALNRQIRRCEHRPENPAMHLRCTLDRHLAGSWNRGRRSVRSPAGLPQDNHWYPRMMTYARPGRMDREATREFLSVKEFARVEKCQPRGGLNVGRFTVQGFLGRGRRVR